ncbi:MAG: hypothetical protein GFH25_541182n2 [Chloroflexi bacterium AL-N10]|nr:hypothetical protein [Chloroflexi bacterium AL-N10]
MLTIEINQRTDVTLEHAYRVWQTGEDVRFSSDAIDTMRVGKAAFEAFVHSDNAIQLRRFGAWECAGRRGDDT